MLSRPPWDLHDLFRHQPPPEQDLFDWFLARLLLAFGFLYLIVNPIVWLLELLGF